MSDERSTIILPDDLATVPSHNDFFLGPQGSPCFLYGEAVKFLKKWNFPAAVVLRLCGETSTTWAFIYKLTEDKVVQQSVEGVFHKGRRSALCDDRTRSMVWAVHDNLSAHCSAEAIRGSLAALSGIFVSGPCPYSPTSSCAVSE